MGKKIKILILMGMATSLISCGNIGNNSKDNISIATKIEESEVVENEKVMRKR